MIRDEAKIQVRAGKGGAGCVSFRREIYVPKGGPDGGDGGRGGHVILEASEHENTLLTLVRNPHQRAKNGVAGGSNNKTGAMGNDLRIPVPVGTIVKDFDTDVVMKDLDEHGSWVIVAEGGIGGRGNSRFKSATNQTPRRADKGKEGEERTLKLELKLIADVGLLGLPNAGKSTLVSSCSAARPKIADYPFTTLDPHPGIVELSDFRRFVMMDIPGLIAGASEGQGLGDKFLRHVERTRVLVHVIDAAPELEVEEVAEHFRTIIGEIEAFGRGLPEKPRLTAWSKIDTCPDPEGRVAELNEACGVEGFPISAVARLGLEPLLQSCWETLHPEED